MGLQAAVALSYLARGYGGVSKVNVNNDHIIHAVDYAESSPGGPETTGAGIPREF
jgi:hypothetical protein